MKINPDIDILSEIINVGDQFLCSYENNIDKSITNKLFFVLLETISK